MYVPGVLLYECIMYQSSDNYVTAAGSLLTLLALRRPPIR